MTEEFYIFEFSSLGFDDEVKSSDRVLIVLFDTNYINAGDILKSELSKEYIKHCNLLILQGSRARYFEEMADDYLMDLEDFFLPTVSSNDVDETVALINGWEISRKKEIRGISNSDALLNELCRRLTALGP